LEDEALARLVEVKRKHRERARDVFRRYDHLTLSCVDATSIEVMRELGIREIMTFDEEFGKIGFTLLPCRKK
jgi:predicted nucleic acid-binding protein